MAGILSRLNKRGNRSANLTADLLVRTRSASTHAESKGTSLVESNVPLGAPDKLLAELEAESKKLRGPAEAKSAQTAHKEGGSSKSAPLPRSAETQRSSPRVRIVQNQSEASRKRSDVFEEELPWWLTDPVKASPQVDILVPAARLVLNDLLAENISRDELPSAIQRAVNVAAEKLSEEVRFSSRDIQEATQELVSLMMGKGPIQPLYDDPAVTDIYLDAHDSVKCNRRGIAVETPFRFRSPGEYEAYVSSMLQAVDRVLNLSSPIVDCVLSDGWRSRINATHYSVRDGGESSVVIRIPRLQQISFYDLLRSKTLPASVAAWLSEIVSSGEANILVIGPTGSGKTTLTTALLSSVGSDERICTIEDVPEIFVPTAHLEKLVTRPENAQGEGAIHMDALLRAALRRAPHRIVVGEIRDKEGPLFLKALETGHLGSVATIHAENPRDGLWRLLDVISTHEKSPQESIQRRIARSLHILISLKKIDGRPCLTDISEVLPPVNGEFVVRQLVRFEGETDGRRLWRIMSNQSYWFERMAKRGLELQPGANLLAYDRTTELRGNP